MGSYQSMGEDSNNRWLGPSIGCCAPALLRGDDTEHLQADGRRSQRPLCGAITLRKLGSADLTQFAHGARRCATNSLSLFRFPGLMPYPHDHPRCSRPSDCPIGSPTAVIWLPGPRAGQVSQPGDGPRPPRSDRASVRPQTFGGWRPTSRVVERASGPCSSPYTFQLAGCLHCRTLAPSSRGRAMPNQKRRSRLSSGRGPIPSCLSRRAISSSRESQWAPPLGVKGSGAVAEASAAT